MNYNLKMTIIVVSFRSGFYCGTIHQIKDKDGAKRPQQIFNLQSSIFNSGLGVGEIFAEAIVDRTDDALGKCYDQENKN